MSPVYSLQGIIRQIVQSRSVKEVLRQTRVSSRVQKPGSEQENSWVVYV